MTEETQALRNESRKEGRKDWKRHHHFVIWALLRVDPGMAAVFSSHMQTGFLQSVRATGRSRAPSQAKFILWLQPIKVGSVSTAHRLDSQGTVCSTCRLYLKRPVDLAAPAGRQIHTFTLSPANTTSLSFLKHSGWSGFAEGAQRKWNHTCTACSFKELCKHW